MKCRLEKKLGFAVQHEKPRYNRGSVRVRHSDVATPGHRERGAEPEGDGLSTGRGGGKSRLEEKSRFAVQCEKLRYNRGFVKEWSGM